MLVPILILIAAAALLSAGLIVLLRPLLMRYALARPNARSSHKVPTPQGGGVAVVAATIAGAAAAFAALALRADLTPLAVLAAAALAVGVVGAVDDIRPLPAAPRLALQAVAVLAVVLLAAPAGRVLPDIVPLAIERAILVLAGLWFVNLVNFMDGLDWITAAEVVPVTAALVLVGLGGRISAEAVIVAAALLGAMLGFAPFNRPVARLFLGDVGSLPIGLILGWLLLELAAASLAAALLLPLYHLADATITLGRRLVRGERVWEAHRTHFYQQATDNGLSALQVSGRVFVVNLGLATLALLVLTVPSPLAQSGSLLAGAALVGLTLRSFATPKRTT